MSDIGFFVSAVATLVASCTFLFILYRDRVSSQSSFAKRIDEARNVAARTPSVYVSYNPSKRFAWVCAEEIVNPPSVIASAERWMDLSKIRIASLGRPHLAPHELNAMVFLFSNLAPRPDTVRNQPFSSVPRPVRAAA